MANDTNPTRRDVLKKGAITSALLTVGYSAGTGSGAAAPPKNFDPEKVNGTIVQDAPEPTFRIDNRNQTAAKVKLETNGPSDGDEYTVGANQASFDPPEGKYVSVECGEVITDLFARRPQDSAYQDSGFTGTSTAPSCD